MEAARILKANLKLQHQPCAWCQAPLALGDDAAVCNGCDSPHHKFCFEQKQGCAKPGCLNAPLAKIAGSELGTAATVASSASTAPAIPYSPYAPPGMTAPPPPPSAPLAMAPPGLMYCNMCRALIPVGAPFCANCQGGYHDPLLAGPIGNAPGAVASMVCGIVGLLFCGIVMGIIAIVLGTQARRSIAVNPRYSGGGMATAGLVLGIIDLVFGVLFMFWYMKARSGRF